MAKHRHATCDHAIAWCRHCDVVYCERCDVQWERPCTRPHAYIYPWYSASNVAPAINTSGTIITSKHAHDSVVVQN